MRIYFSLLQFVAFAVLAIPMGALSMAGDDQGGANSEGWELEVSRDSMGMFHELYWVDGQKKISAVNAELLQVMREAQKKNPQYPLLRTSNEVSTAAVVIPPRSEGGGLRGNCFPLTPGETSTLRGLGAAPQELVLTEDGFYFTAIMGNQLEASFYWNNPRHVNGRLEHVERVGNISVMSYRKGGARILFEKDRVIFEKDGITLEDDGAIIEYRPQNSIYHREPRSLRHILTFTQR